MKNDKRKRIKQQNERSDIMEIKKGGYYLIKTVLKNTVIAECVKERPFYHGSLDTFKVLRAKNYDYRFYEGNTFQWRKKRVIKHIPKNELVIELLKED
jgi:hypothetical protein